MTTLEDLSSVIQGMSLCIPWDSSSSNTENSIKGKDTVGRFLSIISEMISFEGEAYHLDSKANCCKWKIIQDGMVMKVDFVAVYKQKGKYSHSRVAVYVVRRMVG